MKVDVIIKIIATLEIPDCPVSKTRDVHFLYQMATGDLGLHAKHKVLHECVDNIELLTNNEVDKNNE